MKAMMGRSMVRLCYVCLFGAALLTGCAEPQGRIAEIDKESCATKRAAPQSQFSEIDKEFRARVMAELPDDYASVDLGEIQEKITQIAREVYGPKASDVRAEAEWLLAALPAADKDMMAGYVERFPGDSFVFDDNNPDEAEAAHAQEMLVYQLRLWDPSTAAHFAVTRVLTQSMPSARAFGVRRTLEMYVPNEIYRSGGTADEPELLVKSLNDIFVVRLKLHDCGGYIPVDARWLVKGE